MDLTRPLYDGHCRIRKRFLIEEDIIMKLKKLTGTIAAATLVMGMLAGCGASDTAAADTAAAAAETTAAETAAAAETTAETTAAETTERLLPERLPQQALPPCSLLHRQQQRSLWMQILTARSR